MSIKENERVIDEAVLADIDADFAKWAEFLNAGIGILSFSFALSCLGTDHPGITAFVSLIFLLMFSLYGNSRFPKKLRELRKAKLPELDSLTLDGIENRYFGLRATFKRFYIYLFGWGALAVVGCYGVLSSSGPL
ncbi:hypothetical protein [uncultured Microbulbifer sp.]|uniref:hypothetical protein n=1 Tax=uncultured Microbulbifer sp. TaxID=348147 RepID=UPI00261F1447|nr:hypothetical protein [uncultured Microbulbifer sp.]